MTKLSKVLVVAAAVFSIIFMGVAAVMSTVRTDWKEKATKQFPKSKIADQQTEIADLDKAIEGVTKQHEAAKAGIDADIQALVAPNTGREAELEKELAKLVEEAHSLSQQIEVEARKVDAKQEEDKRLREEVSRLRSQYDDLVAHKADALANVKRLRDLLFQAKGLLERVEKRRDALEAEGVKKPDADYAEPAPIKDASLPPGPLKPLRR
jgi:chromosome segregation ATPase